jgi:hypothetical protein
VSARLVTLPRNIRVYEHGDPEIILESRVQRRIITRSELFQAISELSKRAREITTTYRLILNRSYEVIRPKHPKDKSNV